MKNLFVFFSFRGSLAIAMETCKKKKTSRQILFLKMVLGSEIGLLGKKKSFQRGMGEHA
jgi:hypothetical protein